MSDGKRALVAEKVQLKKRVVILGASGFIGRRVVQAAARLDGIQVVAVSRHASAAQVAPGIEAADTDIAAADALEAAICGAAGIVNCIAGSPGLIVATSKRLFDCAVRMAIPPRIVHLSSLAAYGSVGGSVDESAVLRGDLDAYSAAKAETDRLAANYRNGVTLRPGVVYGPGSGWWSDRIARLLVRGRLGDLGDRGRGFCNLVYVDDVADAVVRALNLEEGRLGAFNLSLSKPITWNEYFAHYGAALGLPLRPVSALRLAMETRVLAPPLKLLEILLRTPGLARANPFPPLRPWLPTMCSHDIRMDVTRAESVLGMRWTPLSAGLRTTADWFLAGGRTVR
jgi:2-alkyl-3-oxoalkanoate reductase